jgi:hypothetical protein
MHLLYIEDVTICVLVRKPQLMTGLSMHMLLCRGLYLQEGVCGSFTFQVSQTSWVYCDSHTALQRLCIRQSSLRIITAEIIYTVLKLIWTLIKFYTLYGSNPNIN